eukprot:TRINITY_DN9369_c0_g1_i2.p1 TRINITY_DN9369_c0_g1~~TRINITY_DN9369_c0_g1_i2.p1  ORF type:complete len:701 (+),score=173.32 TRINITY_DN9369_c0_g1_i2:103-2103(+)
MAPSNGPTPPRAPPPLSAAQSSPADAVNKRINDSISRLHAELGRAREQQLEAQRLLAQANSDPLEYLNPRPVSGTLSSDTLRSGFPRESFVSAEALRTPARATHHHMKDASTDTASSPPVNPSPPRRQNGKHAAFADDLEATGPQERTAQTLPAPAPGQALSSRPGGGHAPCIVASSAAGARPAAARRRPAPSAAARPRSYADVVPRYQQPRRPPSPRPEDPRRQQQAQFLAEHAALARQLGWHRAAPRIYAAAQEHAVHARELREADAAGVPFGPARDRPPDTVLEQHQVLRDRLGYNKVRARVYDSPFAGLELPRARSPTPGTPGGGAAARSSSADPRRARATPRRGAAQRSSSADPRPFTGAPRWCSDTHPARSGSEPRFYSAEYAAPQLGGSGGRPGGSSARFRSSSLVSNHSVAERRSAGRLSPQPDRRSQLSRLSPQPSLRNSPRPRGRRSPFPDATNSVRVALRGCASWEEVDALLAAAATLEQDGKVRDAEKVHLEVLKIRRSAYGMTHDSVTASFLGLGALCEGAALWAAAENYYREAMQTCLRLHDDPRHSDARKALRGEARSLLFMQRYAEAIPKWQQLLRYATDQYAADHRKACESREGLAAAYTGAGRPEEARELRSFNEALGFVPQQVAPSPDPDGSVSPQRLSPVRSVPPP